MQHFLTNFIHNGVANYIEHWVPFRIKPWRSHCRSAPLIHPTPQIQPTGLLVKLRKCANRCSKKLKDVLYNKIRPNSVLDTVISQPMLFSIPNNLFET